MEVQAVFVVVLMFAATVKTDSGGVTFSGNEVTLKCPNEGKWFDSKDVNISDDPPTETFKFIYTGKIQYSCDYGESSDKPKYKFYIKGRVCENCIELDGFIYMITIIVELTSTPLLMIIIYKCNKKKSSDAPARTPKAPVRPGGMAPPVPSPDYESLNPNTRSADTYSTVVNRMG